MKTTSTLISAVGMAGALLLASCKPASTNNNVVEISCRQKIALLNLTNGEISGIGTNGTMLAYLPEPTLFFLIYDENEENDEFIYLYLPEDGNRIDLRIEGALLYANGKIHSIDGDARNPSHFKEWFSSADKSDFKSIRLISAPNERMPEINEILEINPDIAVCTGNLSDEIISRGKPLIFSACFSTNALINRQAIIKQDLSETRILFVESNMPETLDALSQKTLPNLSRILPMEGRETNKLFETFPDVKATALGAPVPDLGNLRSLRELLLAPDDDTAIDLSQLPNPELLRMLTVMESGNVTGMEHLTHLEYLNPGTVELSDAELSSMLSNHPELIFLNLIYATIGSLAPLKEASNLQVIMLGKFTEEEIPDISPLQELKHLRYVGLSEDLSEDHPEIAKAIHQACPKVDTFLHDKFCLGSGWLILLLPALLLILLVKRHQSRAKNGV